jgi:hypothetical protein
MSAHARPLVFLFATTVLAFPAMCAAHTPALKLEWNARLRHESVDDAAFSRRADADTLRLRLGLRARWRAGWTGLLEAEAIAVGDHDYNSGANGHVGLPLIADAEGAELNQAWLGWQRGRGAATIGRQRLQLDNQRWLGNSGWRQNEQTFDALSAQWQPAPAITARYLWLARVHRVNGERALDPLARERELDSHLLDLAWVRGRQQFGAYAYAHVDQDVASASTLTTGLRWLGNHVQDGHGWGWRVEAARQRAHADNPASFQHDYWLLEPTLAWHGVAWRAGWEHLGGDGHHALQTPLATLHAFDGWADRFLVTPPDGLEDRYLAAAGAMGQGGTASKFKWALAWHDFQADRGGRDYGRECDASLGFPLQGKLSGLVKLADYRSQGFGSDVRKLWLQLEWSN